VVASWARYAEGVDDQGEPIEIVDQLKESLTASARRQHEDPLAFIANRDVFGDLVDDERYASAYISTLDSLHSPGGPRHAGSPHGTAAPGKCPRS
jgi:mannitol 2-dehydrogenase